MGREKEVQDQKKEFLTQGTSVGQTEGGQRKGKGIATPTKVVLNWLKRKKSKTSNKGEYFVIKKKD